MVALNTWWPAPPLHLQSTTTLLSRELNGQDAAINILYIYEYYSVGALLERQCGSDNLLSIHNRPSIRWLGILGETGR
jgi:hypothetical protein